MLESFKKWIRRSVAEAVAGGIADGLAGADRQAKARLEQKPEDDVVVWLDSPEQKPGQKRIAAK